MIAALRAEGRTPGAIAKELARRLGIPRQDGYRLLTS
jgi:DNA-binding IclR family transcriptional regulator